MTTSAQTDPLIGRLVDGRYRVRARIARGGMATVYVATDMRLERRVALKVMHSHLSDDAVFQSRFVQEARAAARLADPHVVNVFDQGQDGEMAYLVMEYLPGVTLRALLREQRRLNIPQAVTILDAVLSGLAAAHRAGIVHRDVKPENVLLAEDGRIKVGDFGLARATTANTASGQMLLGTIAYLAPELVTRGTADARSDIYALGIMLYEMLTGEQPYKGEQPMQIAFQHATDSVPRPSVKNPGVPEPLDELVLWATEREPDDRPVDAGVMLRRLREIEDQLGIAPQVQRTLAAASAAAGRSDSDGLTKVLPPHMAAPPAGPVDADDNATRLRRRMRRRAARGRWLFVVVIALTALAAATGWWFGSGPGSLIVVPAVAGKTFTQADTALGQSGLGARRETAFSLDVPRGRVVGTTPDAGARVAKRSTVAVVVSAGPRSHVLPALAGLDQRQARQKLDAARVRVAGTADRFTAAANGIVVAASVTDRDGTTVDCARGCTVYEGGSAQLTVSKGPLPNVVGMSAVSATTQLTALGLKVATTQAYSDTVGQGDVIRMGARPGGGDWRPGDTVTLVVSKGPQLFPIPDVTGKPLTAAKHALAAKGFTASYNALWDSVAPIAKVVAQDPAAGSQAPKGTAVHLTVSLTD